MGKLGKTMYEVTKGYNISIGDIENLQVMAHAGCNEYKKPEGCPKFNTPSKCERNRREVKSLLKIFMKKSKI